MGVKVDRLSRQGERFVVTAGNRRFDAENVVVAMGNYQHAHVPAFAQELDADIVQLHSSDYRNPSQLRDGGVLIVGAGNSGAEIATDVVNGHQTWLSGRDTGHIPFRIESIAARFLLIHLVFRFGFHYLLTLATPIGRKMRQKMLSSDHHAMPLVRTKPKDIVSVGIERVPRVVGVRDGLPVLENGRVLDVANVVWCTGFNPGFSWIDLPIFGERGPIHERGVVASVPGLYFVGLHFLYAASSGQVQGVGRDAEHVVKIMTDRASVQRRSLDERAAYATSV
jgi:putative flavoprotein involved in K+ transport